MFWKGVVGYLPVNVVQGVVGLLTIVTFTRLLTPEEYGAYALGFSLMALAHTLVFTWNEAAMARFWAGEAAKDRAADHMATIYKLWLMLLTALPAAGLALAFWPLSSGVKLAVLAGLFAILPRTLAKLAQERRRAAGEVKTAALLDIGMTLGGFAAGAGLALAGLGGAAPLFGAGAAAAVCLAFVLPAELRLAAGGQLEGRRARSYAAYGVPVALSLILALVLSTTDRFLIAAFLDAGSVGVYHAGYSLANRTLDVLFIWLGAAGGPALIMALERGGHKALHAAAREQADLMVLITLPAAVGVALVARPLAELMVGEALREGAAQVTPWIAASGFFGGITTYYFAQAFTLARRTRTLLAAMAIPALANIALNLVLIPRLGLTGALVATLVSYALGAVAAALLARGEIRLPIPWLTIAQATGAATAMALVVSRLPAVGGLLELSLKGAAGALVYGAIVALLDAGGLRTRALGLARTLRARAPA
jgi:O-antigen/teichoic acid export membrane protein